MQKGEANNDSILDVLFLLGCWEILLVSVKSIRDKGWKDASDSGGNGGQDKRPKRLRVRSWHVLLG